MDDGNESEWEENYINNVGKEIVGECANVGLNVSQELVVHFVKLKALNPRNGFPVAKFMSRELIQNFVFSCVHDLMQVSPVNDCIRMQAYWKAVSPKLDDIEVLYNAHLVDRSQSAFEDVLNPAKDDKLLRKIANFINVQTNTANENTAANIKETMSPLKSVLKQKDLQFYSSLTKVGKYEYLKYVARLVSGIRIYQYYCRKGSENLDNAPLFLIDGTTLILNEVADCLAKLSDRIKLLVKELICVYEVPPYELRNLPAGFGADDYAELRHIHHVMIQHEIYMKVVLARLEDLEERARDMTRNFAALVKKVDDTIGFREEIPTSEIYDQFTDICDQWSALQTESCYLNCVGLIVKNLYTMNKYFPLTRLEEALASTDTLSKITDDHGLHRRICLNTEQKNVDLVMTKDEVPLQFLGFCALTLVTTNGVLLPAITKVGILKHDDKYYGFSSAEAAEIWANNPELNLKRAFEVIRMNPQLIELLDLVDFLHSLRTTVLITGHEDEEDTTRDTMTQTVLHPVPVLRDKDYSFSEWQLKIKALQLSRIVKCETKSVQTSNHSHFRASIGVQCGPNKTRGTDPRVEVGCVHETVLHFMRGLRGTSRVHHLDLTRPLCETCDERNHTFRLMVSEPDTACECVRLPEKADCFLSLGER